VSFVVFVFRLFFFFVDDWLLKSLTVNLFLTMFSAAFMASCSSQDARSFA
jgi:positive regulator of sigma E activity